MGYQKKGKARSQRHFNGAERSAYLLLGICVYFAVYRTAELQIISLQGRPEVAHKKTCDM